MKLGMLKRFLFIWLVYWFLIAIQPVFSVYDGLFLAFLIQLCFVAILSFAYCASIVLLKPYLWRTKTLPLSLCTRQINSVVRFSFFCSAFGLLSLVIDKFFVQGIDYSAGLSLAREQWRLAGEERGSNISSVFSVFGYLLGSTYFLPLSISMSRVFPFSDRYRFFTILTGFCFLLANSILTGGRSSILLAIGFMSFGFFSSVGVPHRSIFLDKRYIYALISLLAIVVFYILYIFFSRALSTGLALDFYSISFLEFLGLAPKSWFQEFVSNSFAGPLLALLNLSLSYLTHSFSTTAAIAEYTGNQNGAIFGYYISLLSKLGLATPRPEWFLSGRFPSLPGSLYLDYGLPGLLLFSLVLGIASAFFSSIFSLRPTSLTLFFVCSLLEAVLLLSPFLFAGDFISFPFLIFGFLILLFRAKLISALRP